MKRAPNQMATLVTHQKQSCSWEDNSTTDPLGVQFSVLSIKSDEMLAQISCTHNTATTNITGYFVTKSNSLGHRV